MSENNKYKEIAMFSTIVAEVVITPTLFGGAVYFLLRNSSTQLGFTSLAAILGLILAFYRISKLREQFEKHDP